MYKKVYDSILASDVIKYLGLKSTKQEDFFINGYSTLDNISEYSVLFFSYTVNTKFGLKGNANFELDKLEKYKNILLITDAEICAKVSCPCVASENPRLDFIKVLNHFFVEKKKPYISESAKIDANVKIGKNVSIGENCVLHGDISIGDDTTILHNVVIEGEVKIGSNCVIKSNSTIGSEGFSFVFNGGELEHFPQIGKIVIGDNVWIGSNVSVERAALDSTFIGNNTKIDDLVQIGHNTTIEESCQITAGSIICGKALLKAGCWIAPNSVIDNEVIIGNNAFVGTGSVVRNDVEDNVVVAGVPAKILRKKEI